MGTRGCPYLWGVQIFMTPGELQASFHSITSQYAPEALSSALAQ